LFVKLADVKLALFEVKESVYDSFYPNAEASKSAKETVKMIETKIKALDQYDEKGEKMNGLSN